MRREERAGGRAASFVEEGGAGEEGDDVDAAGFDGFAAAFLAVDEDEAEGDFSAFALDGVDGLEGGSAGGDDVVDDDDGVSGLEVSFDLFAGAVAFGFLADGEDLEGFVGVFGGGGHADGEGDGVGAEGHAADGVDVEVFGVDFRADGVPSEVSDERGAEGVHGGDAAVDVEVALFAGCEGEGAGADGFFEEERFEFGGGFEHGGMIGKERAGGKVNLCFWC